MLRIVVPPETLRKNKQLFGHKFRGKFNNSLRKKPLALGKTGKGGVDLPHAATMQASSQKVSAMFRRSALFACVAFVASCGHAWSGGTEMELKGHAFAPPAFKAFCAKQKSLCSTRGSSKVVELTSARRAELNAINVSVNRRIAGRSDLVTTGKPDDWRLPGKQGDCEDFAILKKSELLKRGWPASALLLTVARSRGEGHTVLTVRTSEGDLVLDNRTSRIKDWSRTSYRYFARQSQSNGQTWERIGTARPM